MRHVSRTENIQLTSSPEPADSGMRRRAHLATGLIFVALFALTGRLVDLQIIRHDELARRAQKQQYFTRFLPARRGTVYDRRGEILASSVSTQSVFADPSMIHDRKTTARKLSVVLGIPYKSLVQRLRKECLFVWVKRHVSNTEAELVRRMRLPGVHLRSESKRIYPQGALAGSLIGFTDIDGHGISGIELTYEQVLAGKSGFEILKRDARQQTIEHYSETRRPPRHGYHIMLTIDTYIQSVVEREVRESVRRHEAVAGMGVVMDCRNGEILAIASYPSFDPNEPGDVPADHLKNRVIADVYEFGSVFKPFTVAGVLDAGLVKPGTEIDCENGAWRVGSRTIHDSHPYGVLDVVHVIAKSSNIGAAKICQNLGPQGLYAWLARFGFGKRTGIDLPGEGAGIVPPVRLWNRNTMFSASFGQGVATTAMFIVKAYAVIANGGIALRPRVVKLVASPDGKYLHLHRRGAEGAQRVMKAETAARVRAMMGEAVQSGTCTRLKTKEYAIGGKTGTAQLPRKDGRGYATGKYLSSMCAIAPLDDPRIVVLVSIREPHKGGHYGSVVAGPACHDIVRETLLYLKVPPRTEPPTKDSVTVLDQEKDKTHERLANAQGL